MRGLALICVCVSCGEVLPPVPEQDATAPDSPGFTFPDSGYYDVAVPDAGCEPFVTKTCDAGCPSGSICVRYLGGCPIPIGPTPIVDLGCVPVPAGCTEPTCACMGPCACGYDFCFDETSNARRQDGGILCQCTTVSRRAFKTDITYVDDARRNGLAEQVGGSDLYERLSIALAAAQRNQAEIERLRSDLAR